MVYVFIFNNVVLALLLHSEENFFIHRIHNNEERIYLLVLVKDEKWMCCGSTEETHSYLKITVFVLNQININIKLTVSVMVLVTPKFAANSDHNVLLLKFSLATGLLKLPPQHEVAARFFVWKKELIDHEQGGCFAPKRSRAYICPISVRPTHFPESDAMINPQYLNGFLIRGNVSSEAIKELRLR